VVVGVNRFTDDGRPPALSAPDFSDLAERQRRRLADARAGRDGAVVASAVQAVGAAAAGTGPVMPAILDAVRARATVGEISDALREVWGVFHPSR